MTVPSRLRIPPGAALLLALLLLCQSGFPQGETSSITGLVSDPSGAVVPDAAIAINNLATGLVVKTTTNAAGVYRATSMPIGRYDVTVEAAGFKSHVAKEVLLEASRVVRLDVALQIGALGESVTVTSEVPLLDPETSTVRTQVTNKTLGTLPFQLTGSLRDPISFIRLTPGATGNAWTATITGGRAFQTEVLVDGVPVAYNAALSNPELARPTYDSVAEFGVMAAVPPPEFGKTSSGTITMVTRSGTNALHGSIVGLFRNNVFDARRYNARIADLSRQAEFSGSVGGPVRLPKIYHGRDRTFFFVNYTGFRRANVQQGVVETLANEAMRRGDFSGIPLAVFDPRTADSSGRRLPFGGNLIPADRVTSFAKAYQAITPLPSLAGLSANFAGGRNVVENSESVVARLDHQLAAAHKLSGTLTFRNVVRANEGPLPDALSYSGDYPNTRPRVSIAEDWFLRPNLTNRVQVGFLRWYDLSFASPDIGIQVPGAIGTGFAPVAFSGQGLSTIGRTDDRFEADNNWHFQDTVAWTRGKHSFKFGGRLDRYQLNKRQRFNEAGSYVFSPFSTSQPNERNSGHAYASFLLGLVDNASMSKQDPWGIRSSYLSLFVQDDWKLTRRLTLNYGLRWEAQTPWQEVAGRMSMMDPTVPNPGAGLRPGALIFAGKGPGRTGSNAFNKTYLAGWGPRLGLAYQLLASSTVIRAGAGLFYAPIQGDLMFNQGYAAIIGIGSADGGLTPAFDVSRGWPQQVIKLPPFIDPTVANGGGTATFENYRGGAGRLPRTSQWHLNLQHTLQGGVFVESSYVGTVAHGITNTQLVNLNQVHSRHLSLGSLLTRNINDPAVRAAGFAAPYAGFNGTLAQALRPFPQYQFITDITPPAGNSTYHAFLLKSEKRFSNGLQFLLSYAASKTLSDVTMTGIGALASPQDQFNRAAEKALAKNDIPQRLVASYTYELPLGKGKRHANTGALAEVLRGFALSGIHTYQSGGVLRVTTPNNLPIFGGHLRPNLVSGATIPSGPSRAGFQPFNSLTGQTGDVALNRAAFAIPDPYTFGNLPVFLPGVRAFGLRSEDVSVMKRQSFGEARGVEVRADFFNIFNRRNLSAPITDLTNPNFGRITGQGSARVVQLGLRVEF